MKFSELYIQMKWVGLFHPKEGNAMKSTICITICSWESAISSFFHGITDIKTEAMIF